MEDGGGWAVLLQQRHPNSAGSLVIARRTEWNPHCFCCFFCVVGYPPNWGKRPRYIDREKKILKPYNSYFLILFAPYTSIAWRMIWFLAKILKIIKRLHSIFRKLYYKTQRHFSFQLWCIIILYVFTFQKKIVESNLGRCYF